jgi:hypothetical protein
MEHVLSYEWRVHQRDEILCRELLQIWQLTDRQPTKYQLCQSSVLQTISRNKASLPTMLEKMKKIFWPVTPPVLLLAFLYQRWTSLISGRVEWVERESSCGHSSGRNY